ncbi:MAG: hypothetical protein ACOYOX_11235, partial [Limnohabitans sp.]
MLGLNPNLFVSVANLRALKAQHLQPGEKVLVWGATTPVGLADFVSSYRASLLHMEDGFVRSVGLG